MSTAAALRPIVLALDTAGSGCSVAVAVCDRLLAAAHVQSMHGQAEALMPMVDSAMRKAEVSPAELDLVAVTVGPGSFTGIRVGLAAARGIAVAVRARLVGVTSFEAAAAGLEPCDRDPVAFLLIALESRRQDLYVQLFDRHRNPAGAPAAVLPAALWKTVDSAIGAAPLLVAGDAAQRAVLALSNRPDTVILEGSTPGAIGALRAALRRRSGAELDTARPIYLRPPDVTVADRRRIPGR